MTGLYVMQDRVSGVFGSVFESPNDETVIRDFKNFVSNPNIPDYAVYDTVIIHLGCFDGDCDNPTIVPAVIPHLVYRGDNIEIRKMREKASSGSDSSSV